MAPNDGPVWRVMRVARRIMRVAEPPTWAPLMRRRGWRWWAGGTLTLPCDTGPSGAPPTREPCDAVTSTCGLPPPTDRCSHHAHEV